MLIEGHLHKQESLGTMPMDRVETIFGVNRCWNTCRLKGVEKSLDSPKPVLDQRHVPSDGVLSINAIPVIQWFAQTSVISLGGVVAPVTCLTSQLSSTTACPNSAGLSFYALCLWFSGTTVNRTLLTAHTSSPLAVAGVKISMVILNSGIRHRGGGSLGWSPWFQLTELLLVEHSFINHRGIGVMLFSRFISSSPLDRVPFDRVLTACIIHSCFFSKDV